MALVEEIIALIKSKGSLDLSEFIDLALFHKSYGYYQKKDPFGVQGDFTTAPEITQIFGELIGIWCVSTWLNMGAPKNIILCEMGPGRGTLMQDLLRATKNVPGFHDAISIYMIETSPVLTKIQQDKLNYLHPKIFWQTSLDNLPELPLILVANELFDALPIDQFIKQNDKWYQRKIGLDKNEDFCFILEEASDQNFPSYPNGSIIEECPLAKVIMEKISHHISSHNGAGLIIDYGYIEPATTETLQVIKNHKYHELFKDIGDSDITAHVNFTKLKEYATGMNNYGPISQESFLKQLGIELRASQLLNNATQAQKQQIQDAILRLTSPDQMGNLFKAIAISHKNLPTPEGFKYE